MCLSLLLKNSLWKFLGQSQKCNDIGAISHVALSISLFSYQPQCITVPVITDYNFVNAEWLPLCSHTVIPNLAKLLMSKIHGRRQRIYTKCNEFSIEYWICYLAQWFYKCLIQDLSTCIWLVYKKMNKIMATFLHYRNVCGEFLDKVLHDK